jgi:hypothetical protein
MDVLLTRVVLERPSGGGRLVGNVTFERPLSGDRDAMDVITTVGWNRRVTEGLHLGFEALAEDLEGLWTPNEATRALGRTGFLMRVSTTGVF